MTEDDYQTQIYEQFSDAMMHAALRELDGHKSTNTEARLALTQMGKALIMLGSSCVAHAVSITDTEIPINMAKMYLESWHDLIEDARRNHRCGR